MKIFMYDFEVFYKDWLVVIINYESKEKTIIINDAEKLQKFYNQHKDDIWVGYNSRNYDQFILKGILDGLDPYKITLELINENKKGYYVVKNHEQYPLNNFDISTGFHSLKQLEGFMGSTIKESSVPFDITRKLTKQELEDVLKYCTHDVEQTIEVFENRKEEFDSQLALIKAFDLSMEMFNKTKAQLSAHILGAVREESREDKFNLTIPNTLKISQKYQHIVEWYKNPDNHDYKKSLVTDVAGVSHVFGWGGIHGALPNYSAEGIILCCDVASLYPALIIEYDYMSRNVNNPAKYKEIRDTRLKLKKEKNPMQLPMKIVLNATYGCFKDKHNDMYDELMANNVCIAGQLLLLDLIEKVEPYCELIQANTDGIFVKVDNMNTVEKIKKVAAEWESRTRLILEWDIYRKIYQKDVNNYIIIDENGKYKSKGAYVKKLSNIDYDLPIINTALIKYFTQNKSIEDTINECDDLREYQKIVKVSNLYQYALYGEQKIKEKVLRVFASKDENAPGVFKVKTEDRIEKIANTPEKCFIYNDNVIDVKVPKYLDKQYYIDIANKRLSDFLDPKKKGKNTSTPSEILYVSAEIKAELININQNDYSSFVDFLVYVTENCIANNRQIEIMTTLNYFKKFGRNKKLLSILEKFNKGEMQYKKTYVDKTKEKRIQALKDFENEQEDIAFPIKEQMEYEIKILGHPQTTYNLHPKFVYVLNIDKTYSPKVKLYGLQSGKIADMKIDKKTFNMNKIFEKDIIQILNHTVKPKSRKTDTGYEIIPNTKEFWITEYQKINLN